ncbi:MAG: hypothetical protein ACXAAO_03455 [Candidatus Thorarchaeota archaeon]
MSEEISVLNKIQSWMRMIGSVLRIRTYRLLTFSIAIGYLVLYSIITQLFVVNPVDSGFGIVILDNWVNLIFRSRAPFNWEPIGFIALGNVQIFLAVPNLIFGLFIGLLVGANLSISTYTYRARTVCNLRPTSSVVSAIPALLTGVACCGPTFLLSLGIASASVTIAFLTILPFLFPMAIIGLIASLTWSGRKISQPGDCGVIPQSSS